MDWNCLRVLDRCARSADLEFDPVAVQLAVDRIDSTAVQEGSQSPLDLVRGPAEAVGFQSSSLRLALSEAVQGSSPHSPGSGAGQRRRGRSFGFHPRTRPRPETQIVQRLVELCSASALYALFTRGNSAKRSW